MYKKAFAVAKLSLSQMRNVYFITGIVLILMFANFAVATAIRMEGNSSVSGGNYFILLPILAAIFIPAQHMRKIFNLGAKRRDFFNGAAYTYIILSASAALIMVLFHYVIDRLMGIVFYEVLDMMAAFGFIQRGPVVAFLQMFAFLTLFSAFIHTLTMIQDKWYGWVADVLIVAIISVFTPIAPLRAALVWFFNMILFHNNAAVQILFCLVLADLIYLLNKPILARKVI